MRPSNEFEVVDVAEVGCDFGSEDPPGSPGVDGPILDILGITPHQVTEGPLVRYLDPPVDGPDLVDGFDFGAEAAVDAHDLPVDDGAQRQVVEDLGAVLPGVRVTVFPVDLVEEAIHLGDLSG